MILPIGRLRRVLRRLARPAAPAGPAAPAAAAGGPSPPRDAASTSRLRPVDLRQHPGGLGIVGPGRGRIADGCPTAGLCPRRAIRSPGRRRTRPSGPPDPPLSGMAQTLPCSHGLRAGDTGADDEPTSTRHRRSTTLVRPGQPDAPREPDAREPARQRARRRGDAPRRLRPPALPRAGTAVDRRSPPRWTRWPSSPRCTVGDILRATAQVNWAGRTSMEVGVRVESEPWNQAGTEPVHVASAYLVFVAIDEDGKPREIPSLEPARPPRRYAGCARPRSGAPTGSPARQRSSEGRSRSAGERRHFVGAPSPAWPRVDW